MALPIVSTPLSVSKAYSPGHITGFFEPIISRRDRNNFKHEGSRGAGFCIDRGIMTTVKTFKNGHKNYRLSINGSFGRALSVSKWVIREYLELVDGRYFIDVAHEVHIPIGYGLGASGAAALSLSYALNRALDTGFSNEEAAQIAHNAEIACGTGLGTVISEFTGGFEVRMTPGAPGTASVMKISLNDYRAVILCLAPVSTKSYLHTNVKSPNDNRFISKLGSEMLDKFLTSITVQNFMNISYNFADSLHLIGDKCKLPSQELISAGFDCAIALFGETLFTLVPSEQVGEARKCLSPFKGVLIECKIDNLGARVL
jgi:pantoate kinase